MKDSTPMKRKSSSSLLQSKEEHPESSSIAEGLRDPDSNKVLRARPSSMKVAKLAHHQDMIGLKA